MFPATNYEMMVILNDKFSDTELRAWSFKCAKILKKLTAKNISVISRGKRDFAYKIIDKEKGNFIQINFSDISQYINLLISKLKLDQNVLRILIIKKSK